MRDMSQQARDATLNAQLVSLMRDGYLVLGQAMAPEMLAALNQELDASFKAAPFSKGAFYGETTKRFGRILARSETARALVMDPAILAIVRAVLAGPVQLNLSQAIEIHPGAPVQPPHRDHDMWGCLKERGRTYMINIMWALDAFTAENGATRVWPRSNLGDWSEMWPDERDAVSTCAPQGSAIIFLGQTLHSGGANVSPRPRRGLIFSYCLDWLLPDENPWLAYPPEIARGFDRELATLVGYRQRYAGLNNYEGRDPSILLSDAVADIPGFEDAMSPEQDAFISQYYDSLPTSRAA